MKKFIVRFALFAAVLVACLLMITQLSGSVDDEQLALAENAVRRSAAQCYAIEGFFPDSIDYLEQNYALCLDRERFVYHYNYIGANLMPDIRVFTLNTKG